MASKKQATDEGEREIKATETEKAETTPGTPSSEAATVPLSRRAVIGLLAGMGLIGAASESARAQSTTLEFGGRYTSEPGSDYGLWLDPDNARFGILGFSAASDGRGVVGRATANSGQTIGVIGRSDSSSDGAAGLQGFNDASSGRTYGFRGRSDSTEGRGALGIATADSGNTIGLEGRVPSPDGVAVSGTNTASSGTTHGVEGRVNSPDGFGLYTPDDAMIEGILKTTRVDTPDDGPLVLNSRGYRGLELNAAPEGEYVNVVGGAPNNEVADGVEGATIAGGGFAGASIPEMSVKNRVTAKFGSISGGSGNTVSGEYGVASGGRENEASGNLATVPGGRNNTADGDFSFAAGRSADTNGHDGAFVFGDSSSTVITAQNTDEVRSQMPIYAPSFNTTSARAKKTDLAPVEPRAILDGVAALDIRTWELDHQNDGRHLGPMAEDFDEQFDLGTDGEHIATVDADGVALAAIQGLAEKLEETERELESKTVRVEDLKKAVEDRDDRIDGLEDRVAAQARRITAQEERITARDDRIADLEAETGALRDRLAEIDRRLDTLESAEQAEDAGQSAVDR